MTELDLSAFAPPKRMWLSRVGPTLAIIAIVVFFVGIPIWLIGSDEARKKQAEVDSDLDARKLWRRLPSGLWILKLDGRQYLLYHDSDGAAIVPHEPERAEHE